MAKPQKNILERALSVLSPGWAEKRERSATLAAAHRYARAHYEGATTSRRSWGWRIVSTDANSTQQTSRSRLRDVARDLVRNNSHAKKAVEVITNNVIASGIIPRLVMKVQDDRMKAVLNGLIEDHFDTTDCDSDGRHDLYGIEAQVVRSIVVDGEVLVRRRPRFASDGLPLPFQMQLLEADYLDTTKNGPTGPAGNETMVEGVHYNAFGKIIGYWLYAQHPGSAMSWSNNFQSSFVPASEIAHIFLQQRPGQARGVSWFAPVILRLMDLHDFQDAHLMRQKIAACYAAFITQEDDVELDPNAPDYDDDGPPLETFEPGMIEYLKSGEQVQFAQPPVVGDYDPYVKAILREIAAGLGISYEALTGDLSGVNFSSGRMGWLEFQRQIDAWRNYMVIPQLCRKVATWFADGAALATGRRIPFKLKWTAPRREMIAPDREVPAIRDAIRAGLTSRPEEQSKLGFDPEDLDNEIKEANDRADELDLVLDSDPRKVSAQGLTQARPAGTVIPPPNFDENAAQPAPSQNNGGGQ